MKGFKVFIAWRPFFVRVVHETLPNEYRWTWPANETATLIIVESINRITGKYYMQITGPKGTMTAGEGTCQRGELKF